MAKHLNNYVADTGLSFVLTMLGRLRESKHAAPMAEWEKGLLAAGWLPFSDGDDVVCAHPSKYNDAWSGNPDTNKYWSK